MNFRSPFRPAAFALAATLIAAGSFTASAQALLPVTAQVVVEHTDGGGYVTPQPIFIAGTDAFIVVAREGGHSWIERVSASDGSRQRLVEGTAPLPSPDGHSIAYVVAAAGHLSELWVCASDGTNARKVADLGDIKDGLQTAWSFDSAKLAYMTFAYIQPGLQTVAPGHTTVQAFTGGNFTNISTATIGIVGLDGSSPRKLVLPEKLDIAAQLAWFHDGRTLVIGASKIAPGEGSDSYIYSVDAETGAMHVLVGPQDGQHIGYFVMSPYDDTIAFVGGSGATRYPMHKDIWLRSPSGNLHALTHNAETSCFEWQPDGTHFYYCDVDGSFLFTHIYSGSTAGELHPFLTREGTLAAGPIASSDGKYLVWIANDLNERQSLYVDTLATNHIQETLLSDPTAGYQLGDTSRITWKSRDGLPIDGILIKPIGYIPGHKYPMIVDIHGGPAGGIASKAGPVVFGTVLEHHYWAARGYITFYPDYRESRAGGWAQQELRRKNADYFERDFDDIMSGVDAVIATGMVDTKRMVVNGHSWGSYVTNWIITHTHRFAAAISYEGSASQTLDWGNPKLQTKPNEWRFNDTNPITHPNLWRKEDATTYVKNVTTPTMFIATQNGINSPTQAWMYAALRRQGVNSVYLYYQNDAHVVVKPANKLDIFNRTTKWIEEYTHE